MIEKAEFKVPTDAHWYLPTGEPFHKVPYADKKRKGQFRDASLRDARKVGAARSVTSVQSLQNKPAINAWSKNQLLDAVRRILPPLDDDRSQESMELWLSEVVKEADKVRHAAAERGHRLHAAMEAFINGASYPVKYSQHVSKVYDVLKSEHRVDLLDPRVVAEMSFYNSMGFGGTIDAYMPSDLRWMVDFKTREDILTVKGEPHEKLAHDDKAMQLSAYRKGIGDPTCRCLNVFIDEKGTVVVHEWPDKDLEHEWLRFLTLLKFAQLTDKHYPTEEKFRFATVQRPKITISK